MVADEIVQNIGKGMGFGLMGFGIYWIVQKIVKRNKTKSLSKTTQSPLSQEVIKERAFHFKTVGIIFGIVITLIIIGKIAIISPEKVVRTFTLDIVSGKFLEAYTLTSIDFQKRVSETDFVNGVNQITKNDPIQAYILLQSTTQNSLATVEGTLITQKGTRSQTIQLVKEDRAWKIRTFNTGDLEEKAQ